MAFDATIWGLITIVAVLAALLTFVFVRKIAVAVLVLIAIGLGLPVLMYVLAIAGWMAAGSH